MKRLMSATIAGACLFAFTGGAFAFGGPDDMKSKAGDATKEAVKSEKDAAQDQATEKGKAEVKQKADQVKEKANKDTSESKSAY
jgi:hypothetical protein